MIDMITLMGCDYLIIVNHNISDNQSSDGMGCGRIFPHRQITPCRNGTERNTPDGRMQ